MIHGVLNVYKEKGYTSHDVVAKLRGMTRQKKIGHTGTLDPDAQGVLPICLGRATRLCDMLTDRDKTYEAVLLLGKATDTQDVSGTVLAEHNGSLPDEDAVRACILSFAGEQDQIPPMYSALKVNGRKLYELAREGRTVERKSRRITVHEIRILRMELPRVWISVSCSKGTYIRTICHDIGEKLGCHGCMESLLRTRSGPFGIGEARKLSEIEEIIREGRLKEILIPTDQMFQALPRAVLTETGEKPAYNGNPLKRQMLSEISGEEKEEIRVYDRQGQFIGIYAFDRGKKEYKIRKMFYEKRG